jgi:replicative DNA helicase
MNRTVAIAPPHDLAAEESVLGAILLTDRTLNHLTLETGLHEDDFYREHHRLIFAAMRKLHTAGEPVDSITVTDQLTRDGVLEKAGGVAAIESLYAATANLSHAPRYATIVRDTAASRRLLTATYEIQEQIATRPQEISALLEGAERRLMAVRAAHTPGRVSTIGEAIGDALDQLQASAKDPRRVPGISTSVRELDDLLGGWRKGRLYVVAARPEIGKSLLVLQFAMYAAMKERARTLFALLEMSDRETADRYLAMESGVDPKRLQHQKVQDDDWPMLLRAAADAAEVPLHLLDDGQTSLSSLRAHAHQLRVRYGDLSLIVVDYLQLMHIEDPSGNRTTDVGVLSRGLKVLAREFDVPVIAVSQLNRAVELRNDKRPQLSDLRETGSIEADANGVLMLYRDDYYTGTESENPGVLEIAVRKNRDGEHGKVELVKDRRLRHLPVAHAT